MTSAPGCPSPLTKELHVRSHSLSCYIPYTTGLCNTTSDTLFTLTSTLAYLPYHMLIHMHVHSYPNSPFNNFTGEYSLSFFKKMGQSRPLFVYFRPSLIPISIIQIEKKCRWCAWDSNPQQHDGRCRQYQGAMAAAPFIFTYFVRGSLTIGSTADLLLNGY